MPKPESAESDEFEALMQANATMTFQPRTRILKFCTGGSDDKEKVANLDPDMAADYRHFVDRNWRELGYLAQRVDTMRRQQLKIMNADEGKR